MDKSGLVKTETKGNFTAGIRWVPEPDHPVKYEDLTIDIYEGYNRLDLSGVRMTGGYDSIEHEFMHRAGIKSLAGSIMSGFRRTEVYRPVYLYIHGGYALSTSPFSCPWDSNQLGYVHIPKSRIRDFEGVEKIQPDVREKWKAHLDTYVRKLNDYLNNRVFEVRVYEGDVLLHTGGQFYESVDDEEKLVHELLEEYSC